MKQPKQRVKSFKQIISHNLLLTLLKRNGEDTHCPKRKDNNKKNNSKFQNNWGQTIAKDNEYLLY